MGETGEAGEVGETGGGGRRGCNLAPESSTKKISLWKDTGYLLENSITIE